MKNKNGMVLGVGVNDAKYIVNKRTRSGQSLCPYYNKWLNMLKRCYCEKTQEKRPSYVGCSVCDEWLTFSTFKYWLINEGFKDEHIDKDLKVFGNKIYSPSTCMLVSNRINNLVRSVSSPCGFSLHNPTGKFRAHFNVDGKQKHLGLFAKEKDAAIKSAEYKINFILNDVEVNSDNDIIAAFIRLCGRYSSAVNDM